MRKSLTRVGLVLASGATAVFASEIVLRATGLAFADQGVFTVSEHDFVRIPGIWEPHQNQLVRDKPALPHRVVTNSLGYRGPDFRVEKPSGQLRVLYAGDSFTFGSYVDDEETIPARLQERLVQACGSVLVVNAGLGGSTITEHREMIERGLVTQPDLVVLQFSENDVTDLAARPMWEQLAENRAAKSRLPLSVVYPVLRRTAIWGLVLRARAEAERRRKVDQRVTPTIDPTSTVDRARVTQLRERYASLLGDLSAALERRALPLLFVIYPSHLSLYGTVPSNQIGWITAVAERNGIPAVDLSSALARTGEDVNSLYLMPHDGHPSARGYEVASKLVADAALRTPSFARRCS